MLMGRRQANENTVLSRACASAKTNVPAASIQSQDCDVLLTQVQGALTLQAAAITRISLALAKYGFLGALNGACKQTLGSQDGGGACWADADCGSNGTCAGLGEVGGARCCRVGPLPTNARIVERQSVKLASVSTLAAALFTASGEAVQARLASGEAARYRALATGLPGALNLSLADAQQVVYLWRRELEAVVQAFDTARGALPTWLLVCLPVLMMWMCIGGAATVLASDGPEVLLSQVRLGGRMDGSG
jgi:hypothetical protein